MKETQPQQSDTTEAQRIDPIAQPEAVFASIRENIDAAKQVAARLAMLYA